MLWRRRNCLFSLICGALLSTRAGCLSVANVNPTRPTRSRRAVRHMTTAASSSTHTAGQGFGGTTAVPPETNGDESADVDKDNVRTVVSELSTMEIKDRLLELLPSMMGTDEEFRLVEEYVNALEEAHVPAQTLDFLNLAMAGDWQLLFSTNLSGGPKPNFRLRELVQTVKSNGLEGSLTNVARWDLAESDGDTNNDSDQVLAFDATGTFSVKCSYDINQGSRMVMTVNDHVLEPSRGSKIPQNVPALVGMLHRAMPKELFDPSQHAADTTYLDGDLRIVRMTGPQFEGVRDIFIRRGSIEIDPSPSVG